MENQRDAREPTRRKGEGRDREHKRAVGNKNENGAKKPNNLKRRQRPKLKMKTNGIRKKVQRTEKDEAREDTDLDLEADYGKDHGSRD